MTVPPPYSPASPVSKREFWVRLGGGILLGVVAGLGLDTLEIGPTLFRFHHVIPLTCAVGGALAFTRAKKLLLFVDAALLLLIALVSYTPLVGALMHNIEHDGQPQSSDGVVVLGAGFLNDSMLSAQFQDRLLHGLSLLKAGYSDRLILTRPYGWAAVTPELAKQEMQQLGLNFAVDVVGPVRTTHDEAVCVAKLAKDRGWKQVILVTHSWHMRRAAAVFEKAGVHVVCSACGESRYDLATLETPTDRLKAFRDWLHEAIGYWVYYERGWI